MVCGLPVFPRFSAIWGELGAAAAPGGLGRSQSAEAAGWREVSLVAHGLGSWCALQCVFGTLERQLRRSSVIYEGQWSV